jgi:two-component system heavy metal sensor histidine kinase CusS
LKIDNLIQPAAISGASRWSITKQLAWFYTLATSAMLILALGFLYWVLATTLEREDENFLDNRVHALRIILQEQPENTKALEREIIDENIGLASYQYYTYSRILDESGRTLYEAPGMSQEIPPAVFPDLNESDNKAKKWRTAKGKIYRLIATQVGTGTANLPKRQIQVALDETSEDAQLSRYARYLGGVLLIGILASAVIGIVAARRGLRPLADITKAAERITASQLHERIDVASWPQELVSLARAFDDMLNRLEDSFNRLSQFSADLAHELRTPINNLRGEAEVALSKPREAHEYREILASSLEEYDRLSRMTDSLLFLAKADSGQAMVTSLPLAARKEIEKITDFYEALAAEQGVHVICEGEGTLDADPILFRRAISNLLSNALHYTPSGGKITFSIHRADGGGIEIVCCDTGIGIAQEHLPKIFDRFYRANPSRNAQTEGAGLGLAIVKSIISLHGGEVSIQSTPGAGTSIRLIFPATA